MYLGIDIGTTTVKACLINDNSEIVYETESAHNATILSANGFPESHEQDPKAIFKTVKDVLSELNAKKRNEIIGIGLSGQMHGVVLWRGDSVSKALDVSEIRCSNLITWMDKRCDVDFIRALPRGEEEGKMATGYGMATLAHLWQDGRQLLDRGWNRCGTIMDLFASFVTGSQDATISTHNAYSWGYCDGTSWNEQIKEKLHIPSHIKLPTIVDPGYVCGKTRKNIDVFADGLSVTVPLGDLQSSMFPLLKPNEAVIHLGTSAQIVFSSTLETTEEIKHANSALTILPYFADKRLITAASLNGGNALECFIEQIAAWSQELFKNNSSTIRHSSAKLLHMALDGSYREERSSLRVSPLFFGERHNPTAKASVTGWTTNVTFTQALQEVARGTIRNLAEMMPPEILQKFHINTLLMINRATQAVYFKEAIDAFAPLCVHSDTGLSLSAAYGAAMFLLKSFLQH